MSLTPKENYLKMLRGEIPEYVPSYFEPSVDSLPDELLTPVSAPNGPIKTALGVTYVGSKDLGWGALPKPGEILLDDITKWRDVIKTPDLTGRDWEGYYKGLLKDKDRTQKAVAVTGGDYFLTLVSFMGFENALMAMYEEPEEVKALLEYVSEFYLEVARQQIKWAKPDIYRIMDDDSAYQAPFFSLDMYHEFFMPLHIKHAQLAAENGLPLERHDCGKCEQFIDDWLDMGVRGWTSAQICNDLKAIKKRTVGKLAITGGWSSADLRGKNAISNEELYARLEDYVNTFAPGGGFVYFAMAVGDPTDPAIQEKKDIVRNYYYDHVRDYYKH